MKRILLLFSVFMLFIATLWADGVEINGICYNLDQTNKTAEVTYKGDNYYRNDKYSGNVIIPNTIYYNSRTYSVTSIGYGAFYECTKLKSVTIPNSVTSMNNRAFDGCSGLTKVNYIGTVDNWAKIDFFFPESNPTFYAKNLYINNKLLTEVKITSADSIKKYAFYSCQSIKYVELGNSVTSIEIGAFFGCSGLISVTMSNSVISIVAAFLDCSSLTSITIPNSIKYMSAGTFEGCIALTSVVWNAKSCIDFKREYSPFYEIREQITSFTIGSEVERIPAYLFFEMNNLSNVNYLGTVDKWAEFDFKNHLDNPIYYTKGLYINNELLTDVKITSADSIKQYAFYNCTSINSLEISNSVTAIANSAFKGCTGITSVVWNIKNYPDLEDYNESPFRLINSQISTFTFSDEVEHIPSYLCYDMETIKEVIIGKNVISIGGKVFDGCSELTSVVWNARKCMDFEYGSSYTHPFYEISSNITSFTFGNEVEHIPATLCASMYSLKEISIPSSVTSIGNNAFASCRGLTSVVIPNSVTFIDYSVFYWCNNLSSVVIPNSVSSISAGSFSRCESLNSIVIPSSVTSIGNNAFYDCREISKVIYKGSLDMWVDINFSNDYSNPTRYAENLYINDKLLTNAKITYADSIKQYTFYNCASIDSLEIGENVSYIGSNAFYNCSGLTSVFIPNNVKYLGEYAFYGCREMTSVSVGENLNRIREYAFGGCKSLTSIVIGKSVSSISCQSFYDCEKINKILCYASKPPRALNRCPDGTCSYECYGLFENYDASLYVPCNVLDEYASVPEWGRFKSIECIKNETAILETLADANITVTDGTISADTDFTIYNTIGKDVTIQNGCLTSGVYVVKVGDDIAKVMVQ